jgi:hypothetical protein
MRSLLLGLLCLGMVNAGVETGYSQSVCQVIEVENCPNHSPYPCNSEWCFLGPDSFLCHEDTKETKSLTNTYGVIRPANPGEPGFITIVWGAGVRCSAERDCDGCSDPYLFFGSPVADCKAQTGTGGWQPIGTQFVQLTGTGNCTGSY